MSKRTRHAGVSSGRVFDFVQMFNRIVSLDEGFARQLPSHEFELRFDESGSIYIDGKPLGINIKRRHRALRLGASGKTLRT